jgi:hypothetical protein
MPGWSFPESRASHDAQTVDLEGSAERPSSGRRAALAEELLVNFNGISKNHCLVHRRRAPISRGISRASSRAATALMFSSSASDDWVLLIGANELFA